MPRKGAVLFDTQEKSDSTKDEESVGISIGGEDASARSQKEVLDLNPPNPNKFCNKSARVSATGARKRKPRILGDGICPLKNPPLTPGTSRRRKELHDRRAQLLVNKGEDSSILRRSRNRSVTRKKSTRKPRSGSRLRKNKPKQTKRRRSSKTRKSVSRMSVRGRMSKGIKRSLASKKSKAHRNIKRKKRTRVPQVVFMTEAELKQRRSQQRKARDERAAKRSAAHRAAGGVTSRRSVVLKRKKRTPAIPSQTSDSDVNVKLTTEPLKSSSQLSLSSSQQTTKKSDVKPKRTLHQIKKAKKGAKIPSPTMTARTAISSTTQSSARDVDMVETTSLRTAAEAVEENA